MAKTAMLLLQRTVLALCLIGVALSAPADNESPIILKYDNTNDGLGTYKFEFETSDGTSRREEGVLRNADDLEKSFVAVSGFYSYVGPDGVTYKVTYIADENGFQPSGDHIPISGTPDEPEFRLDPRFNDRKLT